MLIRDSVVIVAAGLLLCACGERDARRDGQTSKAPAVAGTPASPPAKAAAPFSFVEKTPYADLELSIDKAIGRWPMLHRRLYDEAVPELRKFAAQAETELGNVPPDERPPSNYVSSRKWRLAAVSPRLASLKGKWHDYTGGAHGSWGYVPLFWDIAAQKPIEGSSLFIAGDDAAIDETLCNAIGKAKMDLDREAFEFWDRQTWPCPAWRKADYVLVPSTEPGKFGGVEFMFDPYEMGPYAEGRYIIVLPWTTFRKVLAPAWAGEFGGEPKPLPEDDF